MIMVSALTRKSLKDLSRRRARTVFTVLTVAFGVAGLGAQAGVRELDTVKEPVDIGVGCSGVQPAEELIQQGCSIVIDVVCWRRPVRPEVPLLEAVQHPIVVHVSVGVGGQVFGDM